MLSDRSYMRDGAYPRQRTSVLVWRIAAILAVFVLQVLFIALPIGDVLVVQALRDRGIFATRQLAKRQLTWLRSMQDIRAIDCLAPDCAGQVHAAIEAGGALRGLA